MKGNPELTTRSQKIIDRLKAEQDLIIEGKRIRPYTFKLTDKEAKKAVFMRKVEKGQREKEKRTRTAIPGPPIPEQPPPYFFLPAKKGRTKKKEFSQQIIVRGGRRTRRKRRDRKRKTKKKRKRRRTKKKRRRRHRKTRR